MHNEFNEPPKILTVIEAHLAATGMAESTFGREAIGDWKLVSALRAGRDLRTSTVNRILNYMAQHKP